MDAIISQFETHLRAFNVTLACLGRSWQDILTVDQPAIEVYDKSTQYRREVGAGKADSYGEEALVASHGSAVLNGFVLKAGDPGKHSYNANHSITPVSISATALRRRQPMPIQRGVQTTHSPEMGQTEIKMPLISNGRDNNGTSTTVALKMNCVDWAHH